MNSTTFAAYRAAFSEGRTGGPELDSIWLDWNVDTYVDKSFLAATGLRLFNECEGHPSILCYPMRFGTQDQKKAALQHFHQWYDKQQYDEYYERWVILFPFVVSDVPSVSRFLPYRPGRFLSDNVEEDDLWIYLQTKVPKAIKDVLQFAQAEMKKNRTEIWRVEAVCKRLKHFGPDLYEYVTKEFMEECAAAAVRWWKTYRVESKEEYPPICDSDELLHWCWKFSWHSELAELCKHPVFVSDCFGALLKPGSIDDLLLNSKDFAENLLTVSLTPSKKILGDLEDTRVIVKRHISASINVVKRFYGERFTAKDEALLRRLVLGDSFPTTIPSMEAKGRWMLPDYNDQYENLVIMLYPQCELLWQLRLALAIIDQRLKKT